MIEVQAPDNINNVEGRLTIFLAGTIDMGNSIDWQDQFVKDNDNLNVVVYNPRRDDWDPTWEQKMSNSQFSQQVRWELSHIADSDLIVFNFEPGSKSPITLAELGLHIADQDKHILVRCPEGFYRKGNVDIMCDIYGVPVYDTIEELYPIINYIATKKEKSKYAKTGRKTRTIPDVCRSDRF